MHRGCGYARRVPVPAREIGVPVALGLTLLEHVAVHVELAGAMLHPGGTLLSIAVLWRDQDEEARAAGGDPFFLEGETGLQFSVEPAGPSLRNAGALGFPHRVSLWLSPLPSDAFVVRAIWPAYGIAGSARIDAFAWPALAPDVLVAG
jgi:hypothetical protein